MSMKFVEKPCLDLRMIEKNANSFGNETIREQTKGKQCLEKKLHYP